MHPEHGLARQEAGLGSDVPPLLVHQLPVPPMLSFEDTNDFSFISLMNCLPVRNFYFSAAAENILQLFALGSLLKSLVTFYLFFVLIPYCDLFSH